MTCSAATIIDGKFRTCERPVNHTGRHGTRYNGKCKYWKGEGEMTGAYHLTVERGKEIVVLKARIAVLEAFVRAQDEFKSNPIMDKERALWQAREAVGVVK